MRILSLPFQFGYLLFIFLVWLLWLGLPVLCWRETVRADVLVMFQILVGRLSTFHHWVLYWLWVCHSGFYYVEIRSLCSHFGKSFYHEWVLNFVKCFFCIYWDDLVVSDFSFVNVKCYIDWLLYVNHPCKPSMNPTWSCCMIFFACCWIWFANTLLRISASIFTKDNGMQFSIFSVGLVWFCYQVDSGFIECLWGCYLLFNLLEEYEKNWYKFFVCLVEFTCEIIWSWTFCLFVFTVYFTSSDWSVQIIYLFLA